jgi:DNA-binding transcriptional LysR family regulator
MDVELLERFVAVVEVGSLNKAAARLNLSQPALSRSIRLLEERFSVDLVRRTSRGMVPTDFGQALFRRAKLITAELRKADAEIGALRNLSIGEINIGVPAGLGLAREVLPQVALPLISGSSQLAVNFVIGNREDFLSPLRMGDLDFAITDILYELGAEDLIQEELFVERSAIVVRRGHPLLQKTKVSVRDLAEYSWAIMPNSAHLEAHLKNLAREQGNSFHRGIIRSNSSLLVRSMLIESDVVGLVSLDAILIERDRKHIVEIILESHENSAQHLRPHPIGIVYRRDIGLSMAAAELVARIKRHCTAAQMPRAAQV